MAVSPNDCSARQRRTTLGAPTRQSGERAPIEARSLPWPAAMTVGADTGVVSAPAEVGGDDDSWHDWLLAGRFGGDPAYQAALQPILNDIRDRVLDHAKLRPGERIADIGSGDGMVGFGALAREPDSEVTFVDISPALIAYTQAAAQRRGCRARCRFIVASAQNLNALADASIDVVTIRAVLAYLADKPAAIQECYRILRPGGRISVVDPIFADRAFALAGMASQLRATENGAAAQYLELLHRWRSAQLPDSLEAIQQNRLTNYNERDLLRWFENAGFADVHLRLHIDSSAALPIPWHVFLATSPRAETPTNGEVLATRFSNAERAAFEAFFRSGIEAGTTVERNVNAYIFAQRA